MRFNLLIIIFLLVFSRSAFSQNNAYLKALVAFDEGKYKEVDLLLNSYLVEFPKYENAIYLQAKANLLQKKYQLALVGLNKLKASNYDDAVLLQARANAGLGKKAETFELLRKYLQSSEKQPEAVMQSFPEFLLLNNTPEWNKVWGENHYTQKEQMLSNAYYAIKSKHFGEAHDRLKEIVERYPRTHRAYFMQGKLFMDEQNYEKANNAFEVAMELRKQNLDYQYYYAASCTKLGKEKKAINQFNQILEVDSLYINAYKGRAEAYLGNNDFDEAGADIAKYRAYYQNDEEARLLGAKVNVKNGDFLSAISTYGKLIKENPRNPDYFIGRANSYMSTKTYKYAIKDFAMALDLEPKNVEVYKQKAKAHKLAGEIKKACVEWKYAAKLGDIESVDNLHKYCK